MPDPRIALVTGGTRGIGLETSRCLARQGYRVVITARPGSSALEAALISIASCGPAPIGVELALDDLNAAATLVQRVLARVDRIDLLVQNAVYQGELNLRRVTDLSLNDLETAWRASISAPLLVIRAAHQQMLAQAAPGRILIIGSGAGRYDPPAPADRGGWGFVYGASKAALHRLAGVLHAEHPESGIVFMTVNPGVVDTPALRATLGLDAGLVQRMGVQPASVIGEALAWLSVRAPAEQWHGQFIDLQRLTWKGWDTGLV